MKYLILLILSVNTALACKLSIPESYVSTFLNPPVSGHYEKCEDKPEEKCICVDDKDPWTHEYVEGELVVNEAKKAAREQAEKAEVEAEKQKKDRKKLALERLQSADLKGGTIAQLRAELKQVLDDLKEVLE